MSTTIQVTKESHDRLFPETYLQAPSTVTKLSIIDANVINFSACAATWYLDGPCSSLTSTHFRESLRATLASYPHFCGKLTLDSGSASKIERRSQYGRINVRYHDKNDPGVGFVTAKCSQILADIIPSAAQRANTQQCWARTTSPSTAFLPSDPLAAPYYDSEELNNPGVIVQITRFSCGGLAITVAMTHCLADAHALVYFVKDWAAISRSMLNTTSPAPTLTPYFDPEILDKLIPGNLDADKADPEILAQLSDLPYRPHDQWASSKTAPWPIHIPEQFTDAGKTPTGPLIPWSTYDATAACTHAVIHFSPQQLQRIQHDATSNSPAAGLSMHDALLGHIWSCIARAREQPISASAAAENGPEDPFYYYITLGLRPPRRLALGDSFMGSPIIHAAVSLPATTLIQRAQSKNTTSTPATAIRTAISQFTPTAIGAYLHRIAFELAPQRLWHAFLGSRHTIVTSWVWAGMYDVDFTGDGAGAGAGAGTSPCLGVKEGRIRYAEGVMPVMDGIVQVVEGAPIDNASGANSGDSAPTDGVVGSGEGVGMGKWWKNGVDVTLTLEDGAMARLLGVEQLFPVVQ